MNLTEYCKVRQRESISQLLLTERLLYARKADSKSADLSSLLVLWQRVLERLQVEVTPCQFITGLASYVACGTCRAATMRGRKL